jgi:integrase
MQFLKRVEPDGYIYDLAFSKTNQSGVDQPENHKPVAGIAGEALTQWLQISKITSGPIFRRIRKGGHLGEALSPAAVRDIVKARCALAGIEGDFSAHSLRSGFVTEAGRQNIPLAETMAMTGHHSVATVLGYFRTQSVVSSAAAKLFK